MLRGIAKPIITSMILKQTMLFGVILFLFYSKQNACFGQDSTCKAEPLIPIKLNFALNWDARSSFLGDKAVNIWGVNTGVIVGKKRHQMTFGYYWLTTNAIARLIDFRKSAARLLNLDYYTKTDLFYFNFMYWHNFIETPRWRVSLPVEIGVGSTRNAKNSLLNDYQLWKRNDFFIPIQSGLYLKWKATRWFGLSTQIGYRKSLIQRNINDKFDGIYYSYGIALNPEIFTDLYDLIKKRRQKKEKAQ